MTGHTELEGPDVAGLADGRLAVLCDDMVERAARLGLRIATAESLTGGLVADAIVTVPGASRVFSGGVVAYDTALKHSLLGVDAQRLREVGPVDGEVARQMARGARSACAVPREPEGALRPADIGVSTTGVAGPDPDPQTGQRAGTVWVCVSAEAGDLLESVRFSGGRAEIREATVELAISLILEHLSRVDSSSGKIQE